MGPPSPSKCIAAVVVMTLSTFASGEPAGAHAEPYGWSNCSWADVTDRGYDVTVSNHPAAPFPSDAIHDGVWNSFHARLADSVDRWAAEMAAYTNGWFVMENPNPASDVRVQYYSAPGTKLGETFTLTLVGFHCSVANLHQTADRYIYYSEVGIDERPYWFTQDDSRRAFWEGCDERGDVRSYTCWRWRDVGSTIMHELGHALYILHPEDVDAHAGWGGPFIATLAGCGNGLIFATMCGALPDGSWTAGRTLDWWDRDTTRRHHEENHYP